MTDMNKLATPLRAEPGETQDFAVLVDAKGDIIARDLSPETAAAIVGIVNVAESLQQERNGIFELAVSLKKKLTKLEAALAAGGGHDGK